MPIVHSLYPEPGTPVVNEERCKHCGQCVKICPGEVLVLQDGRVRVIEDTPFGCIACGHCMMICPEGAIRVSGRGLSPEDLVPLPAEESRASADELEALMRARRSIRHFTAQEVDPALVERVVDMASTAPMGIPPWDVGCVVIQGREKVQELAADIVSGYEGFLKVFRPWVLTLMRPFMGKEKYKLFTSFIRPLAETYVRARREGRDVLFYDAPAVILFHHSPYAEPVDAMIACTYAMLAAESLGLGNTIIGGAPPILARDKTLCKRLGIPEGNTPCAALILGHPAVRFRQTIRRGFSHRNVITDTP